MNVPQHILNARRSPEFLSAARDMARKGLRGEIGEPLPLNMSLETVNEINANIRSFQMFVSIARGRA